MRLAVGQPSGAHVATRGMKTSLQGCRVESWMKQLGSLCESDRAIISQATPMAGFLLCARWGRLSWNGHPVIMAGVCADHSVHCSPISGYLEVRGLEL